MRCLRWWGLPGEPGHRGVVQGPDMPVVSDPWPQSAAASRCRAITVGTGPAVVEDVQVGGADGSARYGCPASSGHRVAVPGVGDQGLGGRSAEPVVTAQVRRQPAGATRGSAAAITATVGQPLLITAFTECRRGCCQVSGGPGPPRR